MQHYEMLYIVPVKYSEEEVQKTRQEVQEFVNKRQGAITKEDALGPIRLTYPIKQVHQGYYFLVEFDLEPASLGELERDLRLTPQILRSMIVKKTPGSEQGLVAALEREKKKKKKDEEEASEKEKASKEQAAEKTVAAAKEAKKVSMEEIDEKLDKILESDVI